MYIRMRKFFAKYRYCSNQIAFAAAWIAGLISGVILANQATDDYFMMMRMAADCRVSVVGLLAGALLPFLIAYYSIYTRKLWWIYGVCFVKGLLFTYCAGSARFAFGYAGWLIRPMLQFTDICMAPVLCWFMIRNCTAERRHLQKDALFCAGAATVVCSIDYCLVSPFLAMLIEV